MTRSNAREIAVHLIYAVRCSEEPVEDVLSGRFDEEYYALLADESEVYSDKPGTKQKTYISNVVRGVIDRTQELEGYLAKYSIGWNVNRISSLAKAIMELAMYETLYVDDVPKNVAIHEAVLLAQKYEEEETAAFVNGVLGSFARSLEPEA